MHIKSIRQSRRPDTIWLTFDNGRYIPLSVDDVYRLKLTAGAVVDEDSQNSLYQLSYYHQLLNYALNQVSFSPKVEQVLLPKLRLKYTFLQKKYPFPFVGVEVVSQVIAKLNSLGLLNEKEFVLSILSRYHRRSVGYQKRLLMSKNINPNDYSDLFTTDDEMPKVRQLLQKFKPTKENKNKVFSKLIYRGFTYDTAKTAIDEYLNNR